MITRRHLRHSRQGAEWYPGYSLSPIIEVSPKSVWWLSYLFTILCHDCSMAMAFSVPVMAATLAFVTYTLTAHNFDVAVIFSSFSLFQLLRQPLMFLPRALSAISDAQSAIERLEKVFAAEVMTGETLTVDTTLDVALRAEGVTFEWEESAPQGDSNDPSEKGHKKSRQRKDLKQKLEELKEKKAEQTAPFKFRDVNITIPRGQLVAIVGPVGSGKVCHIFSRFILHCSDLLYYSRVCCRGLLAKCAEYMGLWFLAVRLVTVLRRPGFRTQRL